MPSLCDVADPIAGWRQHGADGDDLATGSHPGVSGVPALTRSNAVVRAGAWLRLAGAGLRLALNLALRGVKVLILALLTVGGVVLWLAASVAAAAWVLVVRVRDRSR